MARENRYYKGPRSDHFDGLRFFNPGQPKTDKSLVDILRWQLSGQSATWPKTVPVRQARPDERVGGLRVTAVGHSSLLIQLADLNILTDPVWSERASPLSFAGPKRVTAPGIAFAALPAIDAVLLSHTITIISTYRRCAPCKPGSAPCSSGRWAWTRSSAV